MLHEIETAKYGPQGAAMAQPIEKCVHCGVCLATCPTYQVMGEETDSPRGRIFLMKEALEQDLTIESILPHVDQCLGCMACVTACPSGVEYGHLLTPFRAYAETVRTRTPMSRATRLLVRETLPYPSRFRAAAKMGRATRALHGLVPAPLKAMIDLIPAEIPTAPPLPELFPAQGTRRARVALLTGCVQQVLAPAINWATLRVLARNGVETVLPRGQGCCGSLAMHIGEGAQAQALAAHNLALFPRDVDAVITNAAGCGSGMHEYPLLFTGTELEAAANEFARRVLDISVFLDQLGLEPPPALPTPVTAAYHDACHLAHAQRVTAQPRRLLQAIPNLTLAEIAESELCCGSAGTYNLEQPELAAAIGARKAANILATPAEMVITGNIGCMMQIRTHLARLGKSLPVLHTVEVLDQAYGATP